jgi:hypothetical protein
MENTFFNPIVHNSDPHNFAFLQKTSTSTKPQRYRILYFLSLLLSALHKFSLPSPSQVCSLHWTPDPIVLASISRYSETIHMSENANMVSRGAANEIESACHRTQQRYIICQCRMMVLGMNSTLPFEMMSEFEPAVRFLNTLFGWLSSLLYNKGGRRRWQSLFVGVVVWCHDWAEEIAAVFVVPRQFRWGGRRLSHEFLEINDTLANPCSACLTFWLMRPCKLMKYRDGFSLISRNDMINLRKDFETRSNVIDYAWL